MIKFNSHIALFTLLLIVAVPCAASHVTHVKVGVAGNFSSASGSTNNQWDELYPAVELALKERFPALRKKNIQLQLIKLDYGDAVENVIHTVEKAKKSGVVAVIGYSQSAYAKVAADYLQKLEIPMITHTATSDSITMDREYIFRACYTNSYAAQRFAAFVSNNLKIRNLVSVYDSNCLYCKDLHSFFIKAYQKTGASVLGRYVVEDLDKAIASIKKHREKDTQPLGIYIPNHEQLSAILIKRIHEAGIHNVIYLGGDGWGNIGKIFQVVLKDVPVTGYNYSHWSKDYLPKSKASKKAKAWLNEHALDSGALLYDTAALTFEGILKTHPTSRKKLRVYLANLKDFTGATGPIKMDANGNPAKPIFIQKMEAGKLRFLKVVN